jgi:hypothetical protein
MKWHHVNFVSIRATYLIFPLLTLKILNVLLLSVMVILTLKGDEVSRKTRKIRH